MTKVRLRFIDLIKSFFLTPPDADLMSRWRGVFNALAAERYTVPLDLSIASILSHLTNARLKDLQDEYHLLFSNSKRSDTSKTSIHKAPLHYDEGIFASSTAGFELFLSGIGITRVQPCTGADNTLVLLLDILYTLIQSERENSLTEPCQAQLIDEFLMPLIGKLCQVAARTREAVFYRECLNFSRSYIDIERTLLKTTSP